MTPNQTIDGVPGLRSLLERVTSQSLGMSAKKDRAEAAHELRALLDAPACKACNDTKKMHEPGQEPGSCAACCDEPAAKPQGETPDDDKSHPRFIAGYTAGLHDYKLGQPQCEPVCKTCGGDGYLAVPRTPGIDCPDCEPAPVAVVPKSECPNCLGDYMFGCDACIPDFTPGNGNKARRRAESLGLTIPAAQTPYDGFDNGVD